MIPPTQWETLNAYLSLYARQTEPVERRFQVTGGDNSPVVVMETVNCVIYLFPDGTWRIVNGEMK